MEPVTFLALEAFLQKLGERILQPVTLYLLGGSVVRMNAGQGPMGSMVEAYWRESLYIFSRNAIQ
jgi:hypothetical protein